MSIDALTIRLVFVFIPGIIAFGILEALGPTRQRTNLSKFAHIFILGVVSYGFYFVFLDIIEIGGDIDIFLFEKIDNKFSIEFEKIVYATFAGIIISLLLVLNSTYSFGIRIAHLLRITTRFSDPDVWNYTFNSNNIDAWATIRDHERGLFYDGYVEAFSQIADVRELLMSRVVVYDSDTGDEVDRIPVLYKSFPKESVSLEFRNIKFDDWSNGSANETSKPGESDGAKE